MGINLDDRATPSTTRSLDSVFAPWPKRKPGQPKQKAQPKNEATASVLQCPELINADPRELLERARNGPVFSTRSTPRGAAEHVYLFLINMPYSGSTALLSLLSTSPAASNL